MSFNSKKHVQFYVEFMGWMECRGVRGVKYVEPVVKEMIRRQRKAHDTPPKLTIQASRKDLRISQDIEDKKKRMIKKIKFPTIPARDVTYVYHAPHTQRSSDGGQDDIVACIFLGYMPRTDRYVHVHVYRFDGPDTAATFYRHMIQMVEGNADRVKMIEIDLANKGEIDDPRLTSSDGMSETLTTDSVVGSGTSSAYSDEDAVGNSRHNDIDEDLQSLVDVQEFDNVAEELRFRLKVKDAPILLPPKDYDTISRAHGNLEQANRRRCLNLSVVGGQAATPEPRPRNVSTESGVDMASPATDTGGMTDREFTQQQQAMINKDALNTSMASEGFKSGPSSPGSPPTGLVHPSKTKSPPMSPHVNVLKGPQLIRQNSYSSSYSDSSRKSQHSDNGDGFDIGTQIYTGAVEGSNDIYAKPMKKHYTNLNSSFSSSMNNTNQLNNMHNVNNNSGLYPNMNKPTVSVSPRIDYPPIDYNEDIGDVKLRGASQERHRHLNLTRSMPPELVRSEMALGAANPQAYSNVRDLGNSRRTDAPNFAYGGGFGNRPGSGNGRHFPNHSRRLNSSFK